MRYPTGDYCLFANVEDNIFFQRGRNVENWEEKRDDAIKKYNDNVRWRVTPPMLK